MDFGASATQARGTRPRYPHARFSFPPLFTGEVACKARRRGHLLLLLYRLIHRRGIRQQIVNVLRMDQWTVANPREEIGLRRRQCDQPTEHIQEVEKVGGVFRQPVVRLSLVERRWRPAVADDRAATVAPAVAESVPQHLLAGDFVVPHRLRDVVDVALADMQSKFSSVVGHLVRQRFRRAGNGACRRITELEDSLRGFGLVIVVGPRQNAPVQCGAFRTASCISA